MAWLLAFVSLFLLTLSQSHVRASPCVAFDVSFNLYAFGLGGKDWTAGTQDTWASAKNATDITAAGRPPFDGANTSCYLAQFFNAIYVLNGDSKNPNSIYIYDAVAKTWSTQSTTPGTFDYSSAHAILDHDTNVFYAFSKGQLFSLNMGELRGSSSGALEWSVVRELGFPDNYNPTMALAQNHIHFLNVGNDGPGIARIFVIHFSFLQPDPQSYPGEKTFPAAHGQATSFFKATGPQLEFAFIPDDFSGTYIINVDNNSTQTLPPPTVKDTKSSYAAGITSLVQLDSTGGVSFVPYVPGQPSDNANATWSSIKALTGLVPPSSSSSSVIPQATTPGGTKASQADGASSSYPVTSGLIGFSVLFAILSFF